MVKCKLVLDESVFSTLHRGAEGLTVYNMNFSNPCDQGCSKVKSLKTFVWFVVVDYYLWMNKRFLKGVVM